MDDAIKRDYSIFSEAESEVVANDNRSTVALSIVATAIVLGIIGDLLLRQFPWGINVPLWVGALVVAVFALLKTQGMAAKGDGRWLWLAALFFAGGIAWRSSPTLILLCLMAVLVALALAAHYTISGRAQRAGLIDYLVATISSGIYAAFGMLGLVLADINWKSLPRNQFTRFVMPILRGLIIAVPLLVIFGTLFMAADAVFEGMVTDFLDFEIDDLLSHLALAGFFTWITAGFLRYLALEQMQSNPEKVHQTRRSPFSLGPIEVGIVLGTLNLLFVVFVIVQFRYFFGGAALVASSIDMSYAEYARRGFFELVTVAALVLPLLLGMSWVARAETTRQRHLFQFMAALLIMLLFVIMFSAVQRMRLYQAEFGLTELRFYTTIFMGWLALLFAWFALTVLRGQRQKFIFGALISGFAVLTMLLAFNPDAFIVRTNVARDQANVVTRNFDSAYVGTLSDDAIPSLLNALGDMSSNDQCVILRSLKQQSDSFATGDVAVSDWRSWNWSRWRAANSIEQHQNVINSVSCAP